MVHVDISTAVRKTQTTASYEVRLNRVVDYLYKHLDERMRHDDLAEIGCLSSYHWHRIYTAMRGETIGVTLRRLRLLRAAARLANSDDAVGLIAERAGYSGLDAFTRGFKEAYRRSPGDYRAHGSHSRFKAATRARNPSGFPVAVLTLPPVRCAAIAHFGPYLQIDRAMGRLFAELIARNMVGPGQNMLAVFFDDPDLVSAEELRSLACAPVAEHLELPSPLEEAILRGGLYAQLRHRGPYADMKDAYRWLMAVWLPGSGHEADDAPIFESYRNSPKDVPATDLLTEIHLPLKAA